VLFELWLKSKTKEKTLWNILSHFTGIWKHRESFLRNLLTIRRTLTLKLQSIFHDAADIQLEFKWHDNFFGAHPTILSVSSSDLIYFWYQFIGISDDVVNDPKSLLLCIHSISESIAYFRSMDEFERTKLNPVTTSSKCLLQAYGRFLYGVAYLDTPGYVFVVKIFY
jgi:hypothetical protein